MPETNFFLVFIEKLNKLKTEYFVTGSLAAIIYGEPRLTHDIDIVIELSDKAIDLFPELFNADDFYCPPLEVIRAERQRSQRGHFNIIHLDSGFKADLYLTGRDEFHRWALTQKRKHQIAGIPIYVAPPEYVIARKLQFYSEGGSEKHIRDIESMLKISKDKIDFTILVEKISGLGLSDLWSKLAILEKKFD